MLDRIRQRGEEFASDWAGPIVLGLIAAAVVWTVWYFTKATCTPTAATDGVCNPGVVARFIDVEILVKSGGAALATGALKGGYDRLMMRRMLNEERELRLQAEQQLADERKRLADERNRVDEAIQMVTELVSEFRADIQQAAEERRQQAAEERQQAAEERQHVAEERRQSAATQQALLDAIIRLSQRDNGNGHAGNGG